MFIVLFFVCLDGLPGEKRSGALKTSKIKENKVLGTNFSGLRRSVTSCNGSREPVLRAETSFSYSKICLPRARSLNMKFS
jgi:hypothetical protein